MSTYGNVSTLNRGVALGGNVRRGLIGAINSFISSFSKSATLRVNIPNMVYIRTKLLCEYISEQVGVEFGIENFLMILYIDFTNEAIKKYDPKRIYGIISNSYGYEDTIKIAYSNSEVYEYRRRDEKQVSLILSMDKRDVMKGELLLTEIYELYGHKISFEKMLSNLWINFIEEYKRGNNQKALNAIIKMLKK